MRALHNARLSLHLAPLSRSGVGGYIERGVGVCSVQIECIDHIICSYRMYSPSHMFRCAPSLEWHRALGSRHRRAPALTRLGARGMVSGDCFQTPD